MDTGWGIIASAFLFWQKTLEKDWARTIKKNRNVLIIFLIETESNDLKMGINPL